jgi:hypothetical protein
MAWRLEHTLRENGTRRCDLALLCVLCQIRSKMVEKPEFDPNHTGWKELHWWQQGRKYTDGYRGTLFPKEYQCFPYSMTNLKDPCPDNVWLCEEHLKQAIERGYLW